jgi:uncharacterized membrane protein YhaH (DUF805 family)
MQMSEKLPAKVGLNGSVSNFYRYYATFSGRSSRSEYWFLWLYFPILYVLLGLLTVPATFVPSLELQFVALVALYLVFILPHLIPTLAITVRRLRDAGFSPYLVFLLLVPFGGVALFVLAFFPSKVTNQGVTGIKPVGSQPVESELKRLEDLHKQGLIDKEQMKAAKNKALGL